jgi:beta-lactamase superfamily II metal-dependent hydrolase
MPEVLDVDVLSAPSSVDTSVPNGSSIAFIAEYAGRRVLLAADAHPDLLLSALTALAPDDGAYPIDLVKLPHHGSRANVTRAWLEKAMCTRFAFSTSGAVFGHPDPEAVSRILKYGSEGEKTLYFNYASERTTPWNDLKLKSQWSYDCVFPEDAQTPLIIDV